MADKQVQRAPLLSAEGLRRVEGLYAAAERLVSDLIDVGFRTAGLPYGASKDLQELAGVSAVLQGSGEVLGYRDLVEVTDWIVAKGLVREEHKPPSITTYSSIPNERWLRSANVSTYESWLRFVCSAADAVERALRWKGLGGATLEMVPHWRQPLRREGFAVSSALAQEVVKRQQALGITEKQVDEFTVSFPDADRAVIEHGGRTFSIPGRACVPMLRCVYEARPQLVTFEALLDAQTKARWDSPEGKARQAEISVRLASDDQRAADELVEVEPPSIESTKTTARRVRTALRHLGDCWRIDYEAGGVRWVDPPLEPLTDSSRL